MFLDMLLILVIVSVIFVSCAVCLLGFTLPAGQYPDTPVDWVDRDYFTFYINFLH